MAFIQVHKSTTVTDEQLDEIRDRWLEGQLIDGLTFYVAGRANGEACVVESWASREACDRALEKFMPVAEKLGLTMADWQSEEFDLRHQMLS